VTSRLCLACGIAAGLAVGGTCAAQFGPSQPGERRVMQFNVRCGTASDGANHWERRKDFLLETIRTFRG
jgi:hypothetical protein